MASQFEVTMQVKKMFFDRQKVIAAQARGNRRALSRAGAFIRRRARSSLRRRKRTSAAGQRPSVHASDKTATLKNILFAYDAARESVVIGPVKLNQKNQNWIANAGSKSVPALMEFGGVIAIREVSSSGGPWRRRDQRRNPRPWEKYRTRRAVYKPRPFMGPAMEAEKDNIPSAWKGSLAG